MTPSENAQFVELRKELVGAFDKHKDEVHEEIDKIRTDVQPAIRLTAAVTRIAEAVADAARFLKWGAALGASVVTIFVGLRVLGVL